METRRTEDACTYQIKVRGRIEVQDLSAMSPLDLENVRAKTHSTVFSVRTDQSGLIGLLRHLHTRRLIFLSIKILPPLEGLERK